MGLFLVGESKQEKPLAANVAEQPRGRSSDLHQLFIRTFLWDVCSSFSAAAQAPAGCCCPPTPPMLHPPSNRS